jgi:hypothetical protein
VEEVVVRAVRVVRVVLVDRVARGAGLAIVVCVDALLLVRGADDVAVPFLRLALLLVLLLVLLFFPVLLLPLVLPLSLVAPVVVAFLLFLPLRTLTRLMPVAFLASSLAFSRFILAYATPPFFMASSSSIRARSRTFCFRIRRAAAVVVGDCAVLMDLVLALGLALGARILFQGLVLRCGDLEPRFKTGYVTGISVRVSMARGGSMGWVAAAEGDGTLVLLLLHIVGNTSIFKKMFNAWFDLCARNDFKFSDGFVLICQQSRMGRMEIRS